MLNYECNLLGLIGRLEVSVTRRYIEMYGVHAVVIYFFNVHPCVYSRMSTIAKVQVIYQSQFYLKIVQQVDAAFEEAVHCKMKFFMIPQGNAGISFFQELSRLFLASATSSI